MPTSFNETEKAEQVTVLGGVAGVGVGGGAPCVMFLKVPGGRERLLVSCFESWKESWATADRPG